MKAFLLSLFFSSSSLLIPESQLGDDLPKIILSPKTILFWNTEEKLNGFKNIKKIFPTSLIRKSDSPYPLTYDLINIDNLSYNYKGKKIQY